MFDADSKQVQVLIPSNLGFDCYILFFGQTLATDP